MLSCNGLNNHGGINHLYFDTSMKCIGLSKQTRGSSLVVFCQVCAEDIIDPLKYSLRQKDHIQSNSSIAVHAKGATSTTRCRQVAEQHRCILD